MIKILKTVIEKEDRDAETIKGHSISVNKLNPSLANDTLIAVGFSLRPPLDGRLRSIGLHDGQLRRIHRPGSAL